MKITYGIFLAILLFPFTSNANYNFTEILSDESQFCVDEGSKKICVNAETQALFDISFTPSYKAVYPFQVNKTSEDCSITPSVDVPKGTKFRQTHDKGSQTDSEYIIHIYEVEMDTDEDNTFQTYFDSPFRLCSTKVDKSNYKRTGGLNTGLLVVPFKLRSGDIYSDSTLGPYLSYKFESVELISLLGISQVSVSEVETSDVETKQAITWAAGVSFEVAKDWDVAFLFGADHLSGEAGENWEYQDKVWLSFAIGFNFTR